MENKEATPSSALYAGDERGAGGKLRKQPTRKPPATPYDRPLGNQTAQHRDGGWLSKLVDPACRLIAGGASKILPSFFSRSSSTGDLHPSNIDDLDNFGTEITPYASIDDIRALNLGISKSTGEAGPSNVADRTKDKSECNELERDNTRNLCDDSESELSKIEQMLKGKIFSREEINRLTEILNSRVVDLPDVIREKKTASLTTGGEAERALSAHESLITSIEGKHEDMDGAILGNLKPHLQSHMRDEVVASPVDIARAYMGSRTSELGLGSYTIKSKDERTLQHGDEFVSKLFIPPPSPKSSPCWPGAMVQDQFGYTTPQSQRGTFGLHNFPRTPYSRTLYSKSKAKLTQLQADSRCLNISSTPFHQSQTPIYEQGKSRSDVVDDSCGSVGPIRRIQNKYASGAPRRGSTSLYSVQNASLQVEKSSARKGFLPVVEKNLEPGGTSGTSNYLSVDRMADSSEKGVPVLNQPSSQALRKILEHLDRHKVTPKEMADELKLATAWKRPSEKTDVRLKESMFDLYKNTNLDDQKLSAEGNDAIGNSKLKLKSQETSAVNAVAKASCTVLDDSGIIRDDNAEPSSDFKNICDSQINCTHEKAFLGPNSGQKDTSHLWPLHNQVNGQDVTRVPSTASASFLKKPPSLFSSMKPNLKSISVNKPDPRRIVSTDNGLGFTFPISASAAVLSEPPTPSIMPSFSAGGLPQPKDGPLVPSYSFGTKKSTPRLVFSFPSTSNASNHDEASDLKFNFGSDKKTRVSFSSVGKDAICY